MIFAKLLVAAVLTLAEDDLSSLLQMRREAVKKADCAKSLGGCGQGASSSDYSKVGNGACLGAGGHYPMHMKTGLDLPACQAACTSEHRCLGLQLRSMRASTRCDLLFEHGNMPEPAMEEGWRSWEDAVATGSIQSVDGGPSIECYSKTAITTDELPICPDADEVCAGKTTCVEGCPCPACQKPTCTPAEVPVCDFNEELAERTGRDGCITLACEPVKCPSPADICSGKSSCMPACPCPGCAKPPPRARQPRQRQSKVTGKSEGQPSRR